MEVRPYGKYPVDVRAAAAALLAASMGFGGCYRSYALDPDAGGEEILPDGIDTLLDTDALSDADGPGDTTDAEPTDPEPRCAVTPAWVTIPAGTFTMGAPWEEPGNSGEPLHEVTLTHDFAIQSTEVTQDQFYAVMGYRPWSYGPCGGCCAAGELDWHEAASYTNALSAAAGYGQCYTCSGSGAGVTCSPSTAYATPYDCPGFRLPTEAEWEYAARAGTMTGTYNGTVGLAYMDCGPANPILDPIAWYCEEASEAHPVGEKMPNAWGLYDMLGNAREWCSDWFGPPSSGPVTDPCGPGTGDQRMARGGCWGSDAVEARAADRDCNDPFHPDHTGFRPVRSL